MKSKIFILWFIVFFLSIIPFAGAQEYQSNIVFVFQTVNDKILIDNDKDQKSIDFAIIGLVTQEKVSDLSQKFLNSGGVLSFSISQEIIDNQRAAFATFHTKFTWNCLKKLLIKNGIMKIIVDRKIYNTENFNLMKQREEFKNNR